MRLLTISKHFVVDVIPLRGVIRGKLMNLKCRSLTHFRWYKDTIITLVYQREDAPSDFWKEKFVAGLSKLFSERGRNRILAKD